MVSCGKRTADECRIKFETGFVNSGRATVQEHRTLRQRHVWSTESDQKLKDAVQRYGLNNWAVGSVDSLFNFSMLTAQSCKTCFRKRDCWSVRGAFLAHVRLDRKARRVDGRRRRTPWDGC